AFFLWFRAGLLEPYDICGSWRRKVGWMGQMMDFYIYGSVTILIQMCFHCAGGCRNCVRCGEHKFLRPHGCSHRAYSDYCEEQTDTFSVHGNPRAVNLTNAASRRTYSLSCTTRILFVYFGRTLSMTYLSGSDCRSSAIRRGAR